MISSVVQKKKAFNRKNARTQERKNARTQERKNCYLVVAMDALLNGSYNVVNVDQFSRMDSLAVEDELCVVRSDKEWIAYKVLCANSSILSIVGSTVSCLACF